MIAFFSGVLVGLCFLYLLVYFAFREIYGEDTPLLLPIEYAWCLLTDEYKP